MGLREEWSNIIGSIKNFKGMLRPGRDSLQKNLVPHAIPDLFLDYAVMLIKFDLEDI